MFPEQIVAAPEIVAVGIEITVTVTASDNVWMHGFVPEDITLTKVYVAFAINKGVVIELAPAESNKTD